MHALDNIKTKKQLLYLQVLLEQVLVASSEDHRLFKLKILDVFNISLPEKLNSLQAREYINNLLSLIASISIITLHLPIEPRDKFIDELHTLCSMYVSSKFVLEFIINPEILGGLIISYEGLYLDLTVKRKLQNIDIATYVPKI